MSVISLPTRTASTLWQLRKVNGLTNEKVDLNE